MRRKRTAAPQPTYIHHTGRIITVNTNYRNHLLDPEWSVAIVEELESNPAGISFAVEPEVLARYDAELGLPCDPLARGYRKLGDVENYIIAYKECAAKWAEAVQEVNDELYEQRRAEADLEDMIEGRLDEEWIRGGMY
jgi:hypothetical protein